MKALGLSPTEQEVVDMQVKYHSIFIIGWMFINPFGFVKLGHVSCHKIFWPDRFSRVYIYWIPTGKKWVYLD